MDPDRKLQRSAQTDQTEVLPESLPDRIPIYTGKRVERAELFDQQAPNSSTARPAGMRNLMTLWLIWRDLYFAL